VSDTKFLSMCKGKDPLTSGQAQDIAKRMKSKHKPICAYRCTYCGKWHVGQDSSKLAKQITRRPRHD
jgi:aspartate carbamoyltransferase regulatory subunit